jgi:hypothetical protein
MNPRKMSEVIFSISPLGMRDERHFPGEWMTRNSGANESKMGHIGRGKDEAQLSQPSHVPGHLRIVLRHEGIMSGKQEVGRRGFLFQFIVAFHPTHQVHDQGAGPVFPVVAESMGAVRAHDGGSPGCPYPHCLEGYSMTGGEKTLDPGEYLLVPV